MYVSRIITATCLAVLGWCAVSAAKPILRANPSSFQFGYMPEGAKVHTSYWLANDGSDTLEVVLVKPQCGCTTAPLDDKIIPPGDSVSMEISFNSKNFHGEVHKLVNIHYNDTTVSPGKVYFSAHIGSTYGDIVPEPSLVDFNDLDKIKQDIILVNVSDADYVVRVASEPAAFITCSTDSLTVPAGGRATITVALADNVPLGLYETSLTLELEGKEYEALTIPVIGTGYVR